MSKMLIVLLPCIGCGFYGTPNPKYCPGHPGDNCDNPIDASSSCSSDEECAEPTPACLTTTMACVQCTAANARACSGTAPICGDDHACRACAAHGECASHVCRPDGTCSDGSDVAYVDPGGTDNTTCTQAMPCTRVAKALATKRPIVKLHGTTDEAVAVQGGRRVTFLADPGAVLTRGTGTGPIVSVQDDGTSLDVFDLSISNAPNNPSGRGILVPAIGAPSVTLTRVTVANNPGGGIAVSGGTLTLSRTTIVGNAGGGVTIDGAEFEITNSFIVQNGGPTSLVGGVSFATIAGAGSRRFEFNTVAANVGTSTVNSGVNCGTVGTPVTFANNVMFANVVSAGGKQLGGSANCTAAYSDIGPDPVSGTGNLSQDPMFANPAQGDFHLLAGSPAVDAADPAATLASDVDGDARPQGSNRDIGADEVKP